MPITKRTRVLLFAFAGMALAGGGIAALRMRTQTKAALALSGWHQQAAGMEEAVRLHESGGKPLLVYFYTDW